MTMEYKIYKINDFIRKTPTGDLDIDKSMTLVREIATTAGFHHDHNLLVDLRQTKPLRNFGDVLRVATEFANYKAVFRNKIAVDNGTWNQSKFKGTDIETAYSKNENGTHVKK